MSKNLKEAWITICRYNNKIIHDICGEYVENPLEEEIDIVNKALQRLEAIDNANPSEALKELEELRDYLLRDRINISSTKNYNTIKQALLELKAIKEANPSEALDLAKAIEEYLGINLSIIKQALLKAQEQEKVLEIIKEKNVLIYTLKRCKSVVEYNYYVSYVEDELTQEEFDTLKRCLK